MLVLLETPGGFALFKVLNEKKLKSVEDLIQQFQSDSGASKIVKLKSFRKFRNTSAAVEAAA